jgi:predicted peroxiredoxin
MPVRGLTIVMAEASPARFRTALGMALAQAALGGPVRLFLDTAAVALARMPIRAADDSAHVAAGLPTLLQLHDEAMDAGVRLILCQSGLALAGTSAADHDPRVEYGGMVSLLAGIADDRLVIA